MASFLFFSDLAEQAWFLGSAVMVASLLLHSAAKPYEDELIDWCEFLSLLSTLFIFQAGVLFKVLNDPAKPEMGDKARAMSEALETASIILTMLNIVLGSVTEYRVWKHMQDGEEDYRVRMLKRQKAELASALEAFDASIDHAEKKALQWAAHRAGASDEPQEEFENPISDPGVDNEQVRVLLTRTTVDKSCKYLRRRLFSVLNRILSKA
jgi:hypothetical protein